MLSKFYSITIYALLRKIINNKQHVPLLQLFSALMLTKYENLQYQSSL